MLKTGNEAGKNRVELVKPGEVKGFCKGEYLSSYIAAEGEGAVLYVGRGDKIQERNMLQEIFAAASKSMKQHGIRDFSCDLKGVTEEFGQEAISDAALGLALGFFEPEQFKGNKDETKDGKSKALEWCVTLTGTGDCPDAEELMAEAACLAEATGFARNLVNRPANMLRPHEFAEAIVNRMAGLPVEAVFLDRQELEARGLNAILAVGAASDYPPCMLVLRYLPVKGGTVTGLAGKGVTLDTGGYCLKAGDTMEGIKGDMAGGAAVAGAVYAMARNGISNNVIAAIPMAENRIAPGAAIPGDVITSHGGATIEILNTDAEGRLLLADAVSFLTKEEKADRILDIATLTGAVCTMFGNCAAGLVTDHEGFYSEFLLAAERSGERFARIPWFREQENMIKSKIADLRNTSTGGCGTITAGLFIRHFADGLPWIHLDIAGMSGGGPDKFAYYSDGGTGFGVATMYYLCRNSGRESGVQTMKEESESEATA